MLYEQNEKRDVEFSIRLGRPRRRLKLYALLLLENTQGNIIIMKDNVTLLRYQYISKILVE